MARKAKPVNYWRTGAAFWSMATEAQTVIALRTLGMMGAWNTPSSENHRMVAEKTEAFSQAAAAAAGALMRGARPDQVAEAAMRPLQRKTRANVARLTKAGPKLPL